MRRKDGLPARQWSRLDKFVERVADVEHMMMDGTERLLKRLQDPEQQQLPYANKKKRQTRKPLAAVDQRKRVLLLSKARAGKRHGQKCQTEDDRVGSVPDGIPIAPSHASGRHTTCPQQAQ